MEFWVYENWTVVAGGKARVHRGECRYCNHGAGQRIYPNPSGRNGRWHGPFATEHDAMNFANSLGRQDVRWGKCCEGGDTHD